jgi:hypothetical protein
MCTPGTLEIVGADVHRYKRSAAAAGDCVCVATEDIALLLSVCSDSSRSAGAVFVLDHVLIAGCTTALVRVRFTMSFEWQNGLAPRPDRSGVHFSIEHQQLIGTPHLL